VWIGWADVLFKPTGGTGGVRDPEARPKDSVNFPRTSLTLEPLIFSFLRGQFCQNHWKNFGAGKHGPKQHGGLRRFRWLEISSVTKFAPHKALKFIAWLWWCKLTFDVEPLVSIFLGVIIICQNPVGSTNVWIGWVEGLFLCAGWTLLEANSTWARACSRAPRRRGSGEQEQNGRPLTKSSSRATWKIWGSVTEGL